MAAPACPSCGAELVGTFCHQCGERALRERDKNLWDFLKQSLLTLAEADSGLRRSFSALFLKPGLLTKEYAEGRRVNYLKPIQLFLLANLCYFLVQPLTGYQGYNTQLDAQVTRQIYSQTLGLGELVDVPALQVERHTAADPDGQVAVGCDLLLVLTRVLSRRN